MLNKKTNLDSKRWAGMVAVLFTFLAIASAARAASNPAQDLQTAPILAAATLLAQADTSAKQQRIISKPQTTTVITEQGNEQQQRLSTDQSGTTPNESANSVGSSPVNGTDNNPQRTGNVQSNTPDGELSAENRQNSPSELPSWVPGALREPLAKLGLAKLDKNLISLIGVIAIPVLLLVVLLPAMLRRRKSANNTQQVDFRSDAENRAKDFLDDNFEKKGVASEHTAELSAHSISDAESGIEQTKSVPDRSYLHNDPQRSTAVHTESDNSITDDAPGYGNNRHAEIEHSELDAEHHPLATTTKLQSDFGSWLMALPSEKRSRYCIEFLLYWISYGDQKVDPEIKNQLNTTVELDDHARIKKAVFNRLPESLQDTLYLINAEFSDGQKEQTLNLLMAVLIKDRLTPMQNLFIRFYSDFIGIGINALEHKFKAAYGCKIPPLPRPDRLKWWNLQSHTPEAGTPVGQDLGCNKVFESASVFARRRFDPALFDLLGSKEQQLVKRHYQQTIEQLESLQETT